jgi:Carboxypeptidase regulatory-like domain
MVLCSSILPSLAREPEPLAMPTQQTAGAEAKFTTFPCGLNLGDRQLLPSMMVRGHEDGSKAIDFNNWSIPFNVLTRTLNIKTKTLPDGNIELRSTAAVARISPQQLNSYPEIGLAIKIKDLQTYLGIKAEFDLIDYTIKLTLPQAIGSGLGGAAVESDLILDGLEPKAPESVKLTAIEQKYSVSNNSGGTQKSIRAAGTIFGSSWYAQFGGNSDRLIDLSLKDAQIIKYSDKSDYIIGGQSAFWNRQDSGNYWGVTGIWRQGFTPQLSDSGSVSTSERTQANKVGRSIVGNARPGTLVRLLPVGKDQAIAEVLVDGTGVFRFDNVVVTNGDRYYQLWLFANGQLSAAPEVREVNFVTVPGQLPAGTTATLASVGLRREDGGLGKFSDVRGSIVTHWGVSEELTVGSGVSFDRGVQGLGELYFQPNGVPLEAAISVRTGAEWDLLSNINWNPSNNLKLGWNIDKLSHRVKGDWKVSPQLSLTSNYDSRDALGIGFNYATRTIANSTSLQASFDTNSRLRWRAGQQLGQWELQHQSNEVGTISNLTYALDRQSSGNAIELSYQTSQVNTSNQFATLAWRYRPTTRSNWSAELGYGVGNVGGGWLASGAVNVLPGVNLRGRYQMGINSSTPSFSLELVSNLETQSGWRENPQQLETLRTQGGIEIIPFFDLNANGQQDPGEKSHLDLELINLNYRPIKPYRPIITDNRISLRVAPGKYRLDFDPAGFPINWRTQAPGYAVEVAAGSYTKVMVPFVPAYTIEGVVTDRSGKPQTGAKVELIPATGGESAFSITSRDGQFYLESLSQGSYQVRVNGKSIPGSVVNITKSSESTQVLNLQSID